MFLLGAVGFLNMLSLALVIITPIVLRYKPALSVIKFIFLETISKDHFIHNKMVVLILVLLAPLITQRLILILTPNKIMFLIVRLALQISPDLWRALLPALVVVQSPKII